MYLDLTAVNKNTADKECIIPSFYDEYKNDEDQFILSEHLTIQNCLNSMSKCEKLDSDNEWYCSQCKEHRQGYKQIEIYRLPRILILQLKRFKNPGYYFNTKIDTFIEFPLNNLNMNKYLVGPKNTEMSYKYDLIGINQHYGMSIGGHYVAICKNGENWYEFDDESVNEIEPNNFMNNKAYLLFYELQNN